jgi:hypothetical protein
MTFMTSTLTITLPASLAEEVRAAAQARGLSPEDYVRQQLAFEVAFAGGGDAYDDDDIEPDLAAIADFERTGMGLAWDEVRAWMASWGTAEELPRPTPRKLR